MTVAELREALRDMPEDADVVIYSNRYVNRGTRDLAEVERAEESDGVTVVVLTT